MTQNSINNSSSDLTVDNLYLDGNTLSSTDTNGNVVLAPDGTGNVSVTSAPVVPSTDRADSLGSATNSWDNVYADGLTFDDGTNILSDYVGFTSFTPTLEFGGGSTGIVYVAQTGLYMRIGNLIWIVANINLSNKGSSTGAARVTGFPFNFQNFPCFPCRWSSINLGTNYTYILGLGFDSTDEMALYENGNNVATATITDADFSNTSQFFVSGVYKIA